MIQEARILLATTEEKMLLLSNSINSIISLVIVIYYYCGFLVTSRASIKQGDFCAGHRIII